MKNKVIISTILFVVVLVFSFFIFSQKKDNNQIPTSETVIEENQLISRIILFYGDGCPHCATVEDYIEKNGIREKLSLEEKEVYYDRKNADELAAKAKICGIPTDYIGVPFLWDGSNCYVGDQEITNFFNQKINEK